MTKMRYFVSLDNNNQPYRLWRFDLDDVAKELNIAIWLDGEWVPRFNTLLAGDSDYTEVPLDVAQRLFPDAFNLPVQKDEGVDGPTVESSHVDSIMGSKRKKRKKKVEPLLAEPTLASEILVKEAPVLTASDVASIMADALKGFNPTIQVVLPESKPITRTVIRDEHGFITRMVEE